MGNSGSVNNLTSSELSHHYQRSSGLGGNQQQQQQQQPYHPSHHHHPHSHPHHQNLGHRQIRNGGDIDETDDVHAPLHWTSSYPRVGDRKYSMGGGGQGQQLPHQPHVKVLPELNDGQRLLRTTVNGAILQSGGTISGRRDSGSMIATPPVLAPIPPSPTPSSVSLRQQQPPSHRAPPPIFQRSKTSINYDLSRLSAANRKSSFFDVSETKLPHAKVSGSEIPVATYKKYASVPDLRGSDDENFGENRIGGGTGAASGGGNGSGRNQAGNLKQIKSNNSRNQIVKKKKSAAPQPPQSYDNHENNTRRPGWQSSTHRLQKTDDRRQESILVGGGGSGKKLEPLRDSLPVPEEAQQQRNQHRKLRLFKTKAESKKTTAATQPSKLTAEASDLQFRRKSPVRDVQKGKRNSYAEPNVSRKTTCHPPEDRNSNWKEPKTREFTLFPMFRREKSFDISLLNRNRAESPPPPEIQTAAVKNAQQRARKSSADPKLRGNVASNLQRSSIELKPEHRKYSQPGNFDFKRELELATKRRSIVVDILDRDANSKGGGDGGNSGESAGSKNPAKIAEGPVPRTRISKTQTKIDSQQRKLPKIQQKGHPVLSRKLSAAVERENVECRKVTKEPALERKRSADTKIPQLTKTFYFGMENRNQPANVQDVESFGKIQMEVIDQFAKSILNNSRRKHRTETSPGLDSSESAVSCDPEDDSQPDINIGAMIYKRPSITTPSMDAAAMMMSFDEANSQAQLLSSNDDSGIQVHVRPTLPRRQLEIPRFSPAAAWRMLLSEEQLLKFERGDTQRSTMFGCWEMLVDRNGGKLQQPPGQHFEERIQRIYREPPVPGYSDNKSGDSGISGDAGFLVPAESPIRHHEFPILPDVAVEGDAPKVGPFLTPWTPQQDLGDDDDDDDDEDENDEDVNAVVAGGGECHTPGNDDRDNEMSSADGDLIRNSDRMRTTNYPHRGHVFSLSLPRESHLSIYGVGGGGGGGGSGTRSKTEDKNKAGFSSLQKLKRTVSGAFNMTPATVPHEYRMSSYRSDNWLLSRSAPNSIDNSQLSSNGGAGAGCDGALPMTGTGTGTGIAYQSSGSRFLSGGAVNNDSLDRPIAIQPSSISYLTGGKHVMYLPNQPIGESSDYHEDFDRKSNHDGRHLAVAAIAIGCQSSSSSGSGSFRGHFASLSNIVDHRSSPSPRIRENLQDAVPVDEKVELDNRRLIQNSSQLPASNSSRNHRFTFQSTVRQIERRRLAEKLSKEAEEKEAQRLSELEAMRRVEQEFQRKRAREKASIRHQLRLFSLEENQFQCTSLPVDWNDGNTGIPFNQQQQLEMMQHRADPDGAVASPIPSPMSSPNDSGGGGGNSKIHQFYDEVIDMEMDLDSDMKSAPYLPHIVDEKISRSLKQHRSNFNELKKPKQTSKPKTIAPPPPPSTEILSEFRTSRREYLEFRKSTGSQHDVEGCGNTGYRPSRYEEQRHPPVVCKIPLMKTNSCSGGGRGDFEEKSQMNLMCDEDENFMYKSNSGASSGGNHFKSTMDNYRCEFVKRRSICSSDSEASMPSGLKANLHFGKAGKRSS